MLAVYPYSPSLLKCHDDFAAVAGFHDLHGVVDALKGQGMCDYPFEVELTGLEEAARAIPGIKDAPPGDAQDGCAFEDDVVCEVKLNHVRGQAQQRNAAAVAQRFEALANSSGMARHFQYHIHPQAIGDIKYVLHGIDFARIDGIVRAHSPMGPQPKTATVLWAISPSKVACTALPNGS